MASKLAINWLGYHREENDFNILSRWAPRSIKLFNDQWRDPFFLERLYAMLPDTVFVFRDHPLSEQKMALEGFPTGTGLAHADYWHGIYSALLKPIKTFDLNRTVFLGINEPPVGDDTARGIVTAYTVAFLDQLTSYGLTGGALNLSVGWPDNAGPDTPVSWTPFGPVRDAIHRGGHYLMLHEYWSPAGPQHNFGWWAGRLGQCPWNVPIIVGECGIDHGVVDGNLTGWQSYKSKEEYMAQLVEYDRLMRRDPRVHSLQIFSYDFTDRWWSFDVRPLQQELAAYAESERGKQDATISFPYYPPNVVLPPLEPEPGMINREHSSPNHEPRDVPVDAIVLHATAGSFSASLNWLISPTSFVSAHYLIDKNGAIYQLVDESRRAWHAGLSSHNGRTDWNDFSIGIELVNNNTGADPYPAEQVAALVWLLKDIVKRRNITRRNIVTHATISAPRKTDPRGLNVTSVLDQVFAPIPVEPPPAPVVPLPEHEQPATLAEWLGKMAWWAEEQERQYAAKQYLRASNIRQSMMRALAWGRDKWGKAA